MEYEEQWVFDFQEDLISKQRFDLTLVWSLHQHPESTFATAHTVGYYGDPFSVAILQLTYVAAELIPSWKSVNLRQCKRKVLSFLVAMNRMPDADELWRNLMSEVRTTLYAQNKDPDTVHRFLSYHTAVYEANQNGKRGDDDTLNVELLSSSD